MHIYDVLKRPVITEKTMYELSGDNKFVFEVDMRANKLMVKDAVETAFDVTVTDVHVMVMPAKTTSRGSRIRIRRSKWKKAIVTLKQGERIPLFEGV
jgi:large subunit ribosomal protein L23